MSGRIVRTSSFSPIEMSVGVRCGNRCHGPAFGGNHDAGPVLPFLQSLRRPREQTDRLPLQRTEGHATGEGVDPSCSGGHPRLDGVGRQNRKVTERVGHRITKEEADRDLDRLCAGVIQRQRPAAGAMIEVNGMRCDQDALCCGGAGEPRDDGDNGEQSAHRQKKVQVSVMVPV